MANLWHYKRQGQQFGPFSDQQLKQLADSGQLHPSDMVQRDGSAQSIAAGRLKGLFPAPDAKPLATDMPLPDTPPPLPPEDDPDIPPPLPTENQLDTPPLLPSDGQPESSSSSWSSGPALTGLVPTGVPAKTAQRSPKQAKKNQTVTIVTIGTIAGGFLIAGLLVICGGRRSRSVGEDNEYLVRSTPQYAKTDSDLRANGSTAHEKRATMPDLKSQLAQVHNEVQRVRDETSRIGGNNYGKAPIKPPKAVIPSTTGTTESEDASGPTKEPVEDTPESTTESTSPISPPQEPANGKPPGKPTPGYKIVWHDKSGRFLECRMVGGNGIGKIDLRVHGCQDAIKAKTILDSATPQVIAQMRSLNAKVKMVVKNQQDGQDGNVFVRQVLLSPSR